MDVYAEWIDACDAVARNPETREETVIGGARRRDNFGDDERAGMKGLENTSPGETARGRSGGQRSYGDDDEDENAELDEDALEGVGYAGA